jgi:hypothetical protein
MSVPILGAALPVGVGREIWVRVLADDLERVFRGEGAHQLADWVAAVVPIRATSGTATTIRPFDRTGRSSHHPRSPRQRPVTRAPGPAPRDLTAP